MAGTDYLNFDLLIERAEEGYRARVLDSPAGPASAEFRLPFSELEVENLVLRLGRTRRGMRRLESPEMEAAKVFGGQLFEAVFRDTVRGCFRSSLDEAERQDVPLRIRLRLTDVPELADLPWEYLYSRDLNRFFSLSVNTPLVRYLELPARIRPLVVEPPLRILAMISSPRDYPRLDVEREWANLQAALEDLVERGLVILERLEVATLSALQNRLPEAGYHVFHFVGHGAFDTRSDEGVLLLEDEEQRGRRVSGQDLGMLLHDERSLRLAILNACEGGRSGINDPFAGAAQSLVQQGIPAVIAMQFEISDEAAILLARQLYTALARGQPVDAALAEARKAIFAQGYDLEWGTPVLYLRAPDGRVFDVRWAERAVVEKVSHPPRKNRALQAALLSILGIISIILAVAVVRHFLYVVPPITPQPAASEVSTPIAGEVTEPIQVGIASFPDCPQLLDELESQIDPDPNWAVFQSLSEIQDEAAARADPELDLVIWGACDQDTQLTIHFEILTARGPRQAAELESVTAHTLALDLDRAARLGRALISYVHGDYDEAERSLFALQQEAQTPQERAELAFLQGNSLLFAEQYEAAIVAYGSAGEYELLRAQAYNNRGVAGLNWAYQIGRDGGEFGPILGAALEDLTATTAVVNPELAALAYTNRAMAHYLITEDYSQAVADCEQAIRLAPSRPMGYVCRAGAQYRMLDEAGCDPLPDTTSVRQDLATAQNLDLGVPEIYFWRGMTALLQAGCDTTEQDRQKHEQDAMTDLYRFLEMYNEQPVHLFTDRVMQEVLPASVADEQG